MTAQQKHFRGLPLIIKLDESVPTGSPIPGKVQVLRTGKFSHPQYGDFEITPQILADMKQNFEAGTRGVDLAIDFGHQSDKEAAAWIKSMELSDDGQSLWLSVEWTPTGMTSVSSKEYRYLSADFTFDYQNNETLKAHGPTLLGAGLTNRPVIKDMAPIVQLQECIVIVPDDNETENQVPTPGGEMMDPKDQKIAELEKMIADMKAKMEGQAAQMGDMGKQLDQYKAGEAAAKEQVALAEKKTKFDLMLSEAKVVEAQREPFMAGDFAKFTELAQPLKLAEAGHSGAGAAGATTEKKPVDQIIELAEEKMKANPKLQKGEAIRKVLAEKPELEKAYNEKK